ncbi:MAG: prolyl oligopeptidase family serine peptidase [Planctomycetota bacterium]|nr:prolyl oligopeptidase family serine peptidase [Planctomycetota bacterium]
MLHGYVPSYTIAQWGEAITEFVNNLYDMGAIGFQPFGRSNTDFQTVGESDILRIRQLAIDEYGADPRRIHLVGISMGGMGVWSLGGRYPDLFSSLSPCAGRTDYYYWKKLSPSELPRYKNVLIKSWNPVDRLANFRGQKMFIYHGREDLTVDVEHSHRISALFDKSGIAHELHLLEGSHTAAFEVAKSREFLERLEGQMHQSAASITLKAYLPSYAKRAWLSVPLIKNYSNPVRAEGKVVGPDIEIDVENALSVRISPWPGLLSPGQTVNVTVNGHQHRGLELTPDGIEIPLEQVPDTEYVKTPEMCGPVWQVTMRPFALVYYDYVTRNRAEAFAGWWRDFAKGECRMFSTDELTPELEKAFDLVLLGDSSRNPYVASIADKLPMKATETHFVLPNGKKYDRSNRGMMVLYPNPRAKDRMVLWCPGQLWGLRLPVNHKFDYVPDYMVFSPPDDMEEEEDTVLTAASLTPSGASTRNCSRLRMTSNNPPKRPNVFRRLYDWVLSLSKRKAPSGRLQVSPPPSPPSFPFPPTRYSYPCRSQGRGGPSSTQRSAP